MKRIVISTYFILSALLMFAQSSVQAKIDPIEMLIGEQAQCWFLVLRLSVHNILMTIPC